MWLKTQFFCANLEALASKTDISGSFMCLFDVASLFTNIPLEKTIQICLDTYRDEQIEQPSLTEMLLKKLLLKATSDVEFGFDGIMYWQIDGVAMGSPLGPVLANIFMGYCEARITEDCWPLFYDRFVDDTFAVFSSQNGSQGFSVSIASIMNLSLLLKVRGIVSFLSWMCW